ncbi:hypothetical protein ACELLULO517_22415 [Acidisoma cellulosilytica]|uniref:Uncharacterized protein n=1 Tax=Acidisoma cellulosilyticum TaxID=2802395 RepID=A0A964E5Y0_9PROT|nr:hypothetical protein [Acidisoma cellulosilyticum]MCB8883019.1 hypothetical protein [Acidisoma cellulosilyticum]
MIRCVRLRAGGDRNSVLDEDISALAEPERGDIIGKSTAARNIALRETASGGSFKWHQVPEPCYFTTLSATLEFETESGAIFVDRL